MKSLTLFFTLALLLIWNHPSYAEPKSSATKLSKIKVLILGDSLTEGYGIPKEKAFPALIEKQLKAKHPQLSITNAGISGSTSSSGYLRLKKHLKKNYNILVLALGSNDALRAVPAATMYKNLAKTLQLAKDKKLKVLLLGAKAPPNYGKEYDRKFDEAFTKLRNEFKVLFMPFLLQDVAGQKELNQEDGIHPNEKGHEIMAKNIAKYLEKLL